MKFGGIATEKMWVSVEGRASLYSLRKPVRRPVCLKSHNSTVAGELAILGIILAILQIADGFLTGFGMVHFGTQMEGNALLRHLMNAIGFIPALIVVKSFSLFIIASLCIWASKVKWLKYAFRGIIALYLVAAIAPWSFLLSMLLIG